MRHDWRAARRAVRERLAGADPGQLAALLLAGLAALGGPAAHAQGARPLTLEALFEGRAFRATRLVDLHWASDGSRFVYRLDQGEGEAAWCREDVAGGARTRLDWSRIRRTLLAARPGFVEPPMDDANAASKARFAAAVSPDARLVAGSEAGDLYLLDLDTGRARFLTDDGEPELFPSFAPDGRRLAFVKAGDLYWVDLEDGRARRLTDRGGSRAVLNGMADWAYEEELQVERSFWWSRDGRRIAFVQYDTAPVGVYPILDDLTTVPAVEEQRYPQAGGANARVKLGVVDLDGGAPRWMDLGGGDDFYLARAGFTPDGARVWYEWLSRDQKRLELGLADAATGASRRLLVEQDAAWINVRDDLTIVDGARLLWTSERDGWRHLYLYDFDGRLLKRLTSGPWQVEKVYGLDAGGRRVFFQATEKDARERHLYAVGLDGGGFIRLSAEDGRHEASLAPGGRHYIDKFSDLATPPRVTLHAADGTRVRTVSDGALPGLAQHGLPPIEMGTLGADDGTPLHSAMIKPPAFDPARRYPAVLYVYGGPHAQLVANAWGDTTHLFLRFLAQHGLVVFWLDNRGSWGRGHAFEAAVHRRLGEQELADQLAGVRHLKSLPFVDGRRLAVYGGSYGGYMALTALLRAPGTFAAGVAYAPVTDWRLYDTIYTERYMGTPQDNPDGYQRSAPLHVAVELRERLLLLHGTMDNNVHVQNTLQLVEALRAAGRPFELMLYPRARHNLRTSRVKLDFHRRVSAFLFARLLGEAGSRAAAGLGPIPPVVR